MQQKAVSRVSKNAGVLLLGTVMRMAMTFAFVVYVARYLGKTGYGKYAITSLLFELFLSLISAGFAVLVTRESAKNIGWLSRNLATLVSLVALVGACGGGMLAILGRCANYEADTKLAIYIACAAVIPAAFGTVAEAAFIAFERAEIVSGGIFLEGFVRTALGFAALSSGFGLLSLFMILIATRSVQMCVYSILLRRWLPEVEFRWNLREFVTLAREWRIFAAETWVATLYLSLDGILLSFFYGEAAVGIYDAAWKLIRFGPVIASAFTTAVFPYISRLWVNARETFQVVSEQSVKYILAGVLPAVLCITIFADQIVLLLFKSEYADSANVLRILAWLLIPQFLNPFLSRVLYARGQQGRSLAVAAVGLGTFLSIAFFLIPAYGPIGTAITVVISSYTALIAYFWHSMLGTDRRPLLIIFMRQSIAAVVLLIALLLVRNSQLPPMILACPILYAGLLIGLRIVSLNDVRLLQELR